MNALQVRRAFKKMTSPQIGQRNEAFNDGWRIADHWCGRYLITKDNQCVARVEKSATGALIINML